MSNLLKGACAIVASLNLVACVVSSPLEAGMADHSTGSTTASGAGSVNSGVSTYNPPAAVVSATGGYIATGGKVDSNGVVTAATPSNNVVGLKWTQTGKNVMITPAKLPFRTWGVDVNRGDKVYLQLNKAGGNVGPCTWQGDSMYFEGAITVNNETGNAFANVGEWLMNWFDVTPNTSTFDPASNVKSIADPNPNARGRYQIQFNNI